MDFLSEFHPPVVHFAIALILTGVAFDIAGFVLNRESLRNAGFWTIVFGALAVWGAMFTGHFAEELVEDAIKGTKAYELLEQHEEIGEILPWIVSILAGFRIFLNFRQNKKLFILYLSAGLIVAGMVGFQGRLGGKMVFEHGVGVKAGKSSGIDD
ncbi:DUF2231 domain-containing protein [Persephonella sp.]|uniref:DUF2231 domain-containing protein n=1 Tax=Persephonella sp. TaxID=2060922 RepID=UPI0025DED1F7|nr:DUF2231 domain-containing protein [Persephonella sp.]